MARARSGSPCRRARKRRRLYREPLVGQEFPGESARYSPRIKALWSECEDWAVANDEMCMDFSMFVMGQDHEMTGLAFATEADDGKAARVRASFQNFGKDIVVAFDLVRDTRGWTIDEITSGCETLSGILKRRSRHADHAAGVAAGRLNFAVAN